MALATQLHSSWSSSTRKSGSNRGIWLPATQLHSSCSNFHTESGSNRIIWLPATQTTHQKNSKELQQPTKSAEKFSKPTTAQGDRIKAYVKCAAARSVWNKLRCMNWSEQKGPAVLTDAYTECVRVQAVRQGLFVRYTSYELLFTRFGLS